MEWVEETNNVERKKGGLITFSVILTILTTSLTVFVTGEVKERENVVQQSFLAI